MTYTVKSGDTLSLIALRFLGDENEWPKIWNASRATLRSGNPDLIYPGEVLTIPDKPVEIKTKNNVDPNEVTLYVNGKEFAGWTDVGISGSMEALAGSFSVGLTERISSTEPPFEIYEGDQVVVKIGNDTMNSGYIDDVNISINGADHTMSVEGRDKTCDLVDCSVSHRPGAWTGKTLKSIASDLVAPFGIDVVCSIDAGTMSFKVQPGETVVEALVRLVKGVGALVTCDESGRLVITRAGTKKIPGVLRYGENIISIDSKNSFKDRFSAYTVEGQEASKGVTASAKDAAVKRYRPLVIMGDGDTTQAYASKRATWEAAVRAGKSKTVTVVVSGWRTATGELWQDNALVEVDAKPARVSGEFLITQVNFNRSAQDGTTTTLILKNKAAFTPEVPDGKTDPANERKAYQPAARYMKS